MEALENNIKERYLGLRKSADIIISELNDATQKRDALRAIIISKKKDNPEAVFSDVRQELISVQDEAWNIYIREKELEKVYYGITILAEIGIENGIEFTKDEDDKKFLAEVMEMTKSFLVIDKVKGITKLADYDQYEKVIKPSRDMALTDKNLQISFSSPYFDVK